MVLLALGACKAHRSTSMFPSGEEWLHWNESAREQYIRAYVEGNMEGFAAGCEQADSLMISPANGVEFVDANNRCVAHMPFTEGRNVMKLIPSVTAFFDRYTEHRELGVSQVLRELDAGRTVEEVHEDFSSKH
jgi:hypothetical protein